MKSEKLFGTIREQKPRRYVENGVRFAILSGTIILAGMVIAGVNAGSKGTVFNYSLDFVGGTSTSVVFPEELPEGIQGNLELLVYETTGKNAEISLVESDNTALIRTTNLEQEERAAIIDRLVSDFGVDAEQVESENISSVVSGEMKKDAIWATVIAIICMLLYIWIRFKNINFALSAVIALIHDVLIVIVVYIVARNFISVGSKFIECILTIIGY